MTQWIYEGNLNNVIEDSAPWTDPVTGTQYPGNWPKSSISGFQSVVSTQPPDPSANAVTGCSVQLVNGVPTQVWQYTPYTVAQISLAQASALTQTVVNAVNSLLDSTAQSQGYDNAGSCISYASSTNSLWANQAKAFVAWRDVVWAMAYSVQAEPASNRPTTVAAFLALLPPMVWPTS